MKALAQPPAPPAQGHYALSYAKQKVKSLNASFGGRFEYAYVLRDGVFTPRLRVEYQHEFYDLGHADIRYADWVASPTYTTTLRTFDHDRLVLGLGGAMQRESSAFSLDVSTTTATSQQTNNQVRAEYRLSF